jgi:hypothetical protein
MSIPVASRSLAATDIIWAENEYSDLCRHCSVDWNSRKIMNIRYKVNYCNSGLRKMRHRSSLHILLLVTVLERKKIWKLANGVYTSSLWFSATDLIYTASNIVTLKLAHNDSTLITTYVLLLPCLTERSYKTISCADRLRGQCRTKGAACLRGHRHHSPANASKFLATDFFTIVNLFNAVNR